MLGWWASIEQESGFELAKGPSRARRSVQGAGGRNPGAGIFARQCGKDRVRGYDESCKIAGCRWMPRTKASSISVMELNENARKQLRISSQRWRLVPDLFQAA